MSSLSEEVEALRKRVENLSTENRDLENSNMLLSKVIQMRDRQMGDLRTVIMSNAGREDSGSTLQSKEPSTYKDNDEGSPHRKWDMSHRLQEHHHPSKFLNVQHTMMRETWKQYVQLLSERLVMYDADPTNVALRQEIREKHDELGEISLKCANLSPSSMCTLVASGDAEHDLPSDPEELEKLWSRVLASLRLTPNQERLLLNRRQSFKDHLEVVWKKRTILSDKLQGYIKTKEDTFRSNVWSCRGGTGVRQILQELNDAAMSDCQQHTDLFYSFFFSILDEIQGARAYVESYPFYPDVLLMANVLHKQHQGVDGDSLDDKTQSTSIPSDLTSQN